MPKLMRCGRTKIGREPFRRLEYIYSLGESDGDDLLDALQVTDGHRNLFFLNQYAKQIGCIVMVRMMFSSQPVPTLGLIIGTVNANMWLNIMQKHAIHPCILSIFKQDCIFYKEQRPMPLRKWVQGKFEQEYVEVKLFRARNIHQIEYPSIITTKSRNNNHQL